MDIRNIIILIAFFANLFLGLFIYFRGRNNKSSIAYSLATWAVAFWAISMILYRAAFDIGDSLFWCRVLYISAPLIPYAFLRFSYIFPSGKFDISKTKRFLFTIPVLGIIFLVIYSDFIIKDVIFNSGEEKGIVFGPLYSLYIIYFSIYFIWPLWNLFKKYRPSTGILRMQLRYMLIGILISIVFGTLFNLFLPTIGYFELNWAGQVSTLVMILLIAYAILKYRLMDIRMVVKRSTIFSLIVIAITAIYAMSAYLVSWVIFGGIYTFQTQIITGLIVALLVAIGFRPLYEWLKRTTDTFLFKGEYLPQELMADISDVVSRTLELETVIDVLKNKIIKALRIKKIEIIILEDEEANISITRGDFLMTSKKKKALKKIVDYFKKQRDVLVLEELKRKHEENVQSNKIHSLINRIEDLKASLIVPLMVKNKLVGIFLLSAKRSGDMFTNEDIKTLETIASQAGIAIENSRLYEEMKDFSKTLQKEVNSQTKELRDANIRLQQLDSAKSEFISLASHQLRTPLSIIKGYVSMVIEGTWGKITDEQKEQLNKVYLSNERLIRLVEDLLTVSRIESGRLEFKWELISLEDMIESVVQEFSQVASKKNLYLKFIKPEKELPKIKIDSLKIRQVVQNLVDNALHYTKEGGITINLKERKNNLVFSIKDTGIGIPEKEQAVLFEKFSRGREVGKMHTEGVGLGLYLGAKMVIAHKGKIWVESEGKGKGSTFYFELPIKRKR